MKQVRLLDQGRSDMRASRLSPAFVPTICLTLALSTAPLTAQEGLREVPVRRTGIYGGLNFSLGVPTGEFNRNVDVSPGAALNLVIPFAADGSLGVLLQLGFLVYGSETSRLPFPGTGGLVELDLTTTNTLTFAGAGFQYVRRGGAVMPYLNGTLGGSYLSTDSSVEGSNNTGSFASSTNFDDVVFAATAGGGLYIHLSHKVSLDVGGQFHSGGLADYLTKSDIIDNGNGTVTLRPRTSRTDFVQVQIGLEFGL